MKGKTIKEEITNAVASEQATENPFPDENKEPPPKKAINFQLYGR